MAQIILSVITPIVAAIFILIGYKVQKHLELRNQIIKEKLEIYSNYFRSYWSACEGESNNAEVTHWKTMIILYAPDNVVKNLDKFSKAIHKKDVEDYKKLTDELLIAMRQDVVKNSELRMSDIVFCSPLLLNDIRNDDKESK
ncbi:MAG TPA: hypothetical protein PLF50_05005 [Candidatus Cloacimonadota bacterium]|nr:hypothetical protein [Candidatus Cloacimonadota bacterium]